MLTETSQIAGYAGRIRQFLVRPYGSPAVRQTILHLLLTVLVGISIGFAVLLATSGELMEMVLLIAMVLSPFLLIVGARLFGSLERLLLAVLLMDLSLGVDVNLFYRELEASVSAIGGFYFSVITLSLGALYGWWLLDFLTKRRRIPLGALLMTNRPLVAYLFFVIISMAVARDPMLALFEVNIVVQGLLLYLFLVYTIRTRSDLLFVIFFLMLGLAVQSLLSIALGVTGSELDLGFISAETDSSGRIGGTVGGPNATGSYLSMLLSLAFGLMLSSVARWVKFLTAVVSVCGMAALVLTFSRGGWGSFAISIALIGTLSFLRGWLPLLFPLTVFSAFAAIVIPLREYILERIFGSDGGSLEARLPLIKLAWSIIRDHPFLGVGANNFVAVTPEYLTPEYTEAWIHVVHNKYLLVWSESGIGALAAFLAFLLGTIYRGWSVWQWKDRFLSPLALSLSTALLGWMVHMFVALFHDKTPVFLLFLASALITAIYRMERATP